MCEAEKIGVEELENIAIFGFDGKMLIFSSMILNIINCTSIGAIKCSLKVHPDKKHFIFPLGCKVSIMNRTTCKQEFLCGHTNQVSKVAVSKTLVFVSIINFYFLRP